jgi:hypothetical protein
MNDKGRCEVKEKWWDVIEIEKQRKDERGGWRRCVRWEWEGNTKGRRASEDESGRNECTLAPV